ncbi:unnamed protein product [Moritella viscosa]|nr:unnamed protein product [Moritella viscosa]
MITVLTIQYIDIICKLQSSHYAPLNIKIALLFNQSQVHFS